MEDAAVNGGGVHHGRRVQGVARSERGRGITRLLLVLSDERADMATKKTKAAVGAMTTATDPALIPPAKTTKKGKPAKGTR